MQHESQLPQQCCGWMIFRLPKKTVFFCAYHWCNLDDTIIDAVSIFPQIWVKTSHTQKNVTSLNSIQIFRWWIEREKIFLCENLKRHHWPSHRVSRRFSISESSISLSQILYARAIVWKIYDRPWTWWDAWISRDQNNQLRMKVMWKLKIDSRHYIYSLSRFIKSSSIISLRTSLWYGNFITDECARSHLFSLTSLDCIASKKLPKLWLNFNSIVSLNPSRTRPQWHFFSQFSFDRLSLSV